MTSNKIQRRPSLLFDEYEKEVIVPEQILKKVPILKDEATLKLSALKPISVDEMDMIALQTSFDQQMIKGSPMYLDPDEEEMVNPVTMETFNFQHYTTTRVQKGQSINSIPTDSTHFCLKKIDKINNPFEKLRKLRLNFIRGSFQDNGSNIKYDIENWLVYPKALPKFWKFSKDERFKEEDESNYDLTNPSNKCRNGYYYPHPYDQDFGGEKKNKIEYTGAFFELNKYISENAKNRKLKHLDKTNKIQREIPTFKEFKENLEFVVKLSQQHAMKEIATKRLDYLLDKFDLFQHLKSKSEILENKQVPYRDFYNSRKVDQHLLLSGIISQRQLSEFIWEKMLQEPEKIVYITYTGDQLTIKDVFTITEGKEVEIGLKLVDDEFLDWYMDEYLPFYHLIDLPQEYIEKKLHGKKLRYYILIKTFLEFDNLIEGEFLAQILIKYVIHFLEKSKYQLVQIAIDFKFYARDIGYRKNNWWTKFSIWLIKWKLISYNIRWDVQFRRVYSKLHENKLVNNFQDYFDLIFDPLFENEANEELQFFLTNVCSFDLVISQSDEYLWEYFPDIECLPAKWTVSDNPTISHYMYYIFARLSKYNMERFNRYQNTIVLRSYCSPRVSTRSSQISSSSIYMSEKEESLVCNLLLCNGGLLKAESIQESSSSLLYFFYLFQIPLITAPLSSVSGHTVAVHPSSYQDSRLDKNDFETTPPLKHSRDISVTEQYSYKNNPFMRLTKIGFKVSISSNSVLYNSSYTLEPIIEEYSVAASIYLLNAADLCEFARNSVISSGYDGFYKAHWAGVTNKELPHSPASETLGLVDVWYDKVEDTRIKHNVPHIRREYRNETLNQEWSFVKDYFV